MKCIYLSVLLIAMFAVSAIALPVEIIQVELDGDELDATADNGVRAIDRDNEFEVKVEVRATADVEDAQIEVYLRGYDQDDLIEDISDVFDMREGRTYVKKFSLTFPYRVEKDEYKLRVRVEDRDGDSTQETYELAIEASRHDMRIKDVVFSPSGSVMAGRSLLTTVRIQNVGMQDQDGVKVVISVPELGISASDFIDEVEEDDSVTSEELFLRIPACAKGGTYDALVFVEYRDGDRVETLTERITIAEDPLCAKETTAPMQPKTIITVGPSTQDIVQGEGGVIYPVTISNAGAEAKTYVISLDGYSDWSTVTVSPSNVIVLQPGEAKAIYVYVTAMETAQAGEHTFALKVMSGSETLKEFLLKANVIASEAPAGTDWGTLKRALEIGVVVLIVILVIFGLIIGFSRLRSNEKEGPGDEGKNDNYY